MKAFKCDVCRGYFVDYSIEGLYKIEEPVTKFEAIASIDFINSLFTEEGKHWDLCSACQNELNKTVSDFILKRRRGTHTPPPSSIEIP